MYSNNDYRSYELYHHGIMGQKWGIRRYQNSDGSLTEEGKKRYSKLVSKRDSLDRSIRKSNDRLTKMESKIEKNNYKAKKALYKQQKLEAKRDKYTDAWDADKYRKYDTKAQKQASIAKKYSDPKLELKYQKEKVKNLNLNVKLSKVDSSIEKLGGDVVSKALEEQGYVKLKRVRA